MDTDKNKESEKDEGTKNAMDVDQDNNDTMKEEKEEIFEDVGGIQFEVYPKYNEEIHIATEQKHRFPEGFDRYKYNKDLLDFTPSDKQLELGQNVYFFSHSMPRSMFRDVLVSDIEILQKNNP